MSDSNQALDAFFAAKERKGRLLVRNIVVVNAILTVIAFVSALIVGVASFSTFVVMLFWLFVYVMLYMGKSWAKWLFIIAAALNAFTLVIRFFQFLSLLPLPGGIVFALLVQVAGVAAMVVSAVLLLTSDAVKDFLYGQETSG